MRRFLPLLFVGCSSAPATPQFDAGTMDAVSKPTPTWHGDVAPIVVARCAACHVPGGMGPFTLTNFADAYAHHDAMAAAVLAGRMPPWLPDESCRAHVAARNLSQAEIDTIAAWSAGDAPEGTPKTPMTPAPAKLAWVDQSVDIGTDWTPTPPPGEKDDWRCFVMDPHLAEDAILLGYDMAPTVRSQVHHVGVVEAPLDQAMAADAQDPDPGYPCAAGVGVGSRVVVSWASGFGAVSYPAGTGMRIHAGSALVAQIHYHVWDPSSKQLPDRTRLDLQFARAPVDHELRYVSMLQPPTIPPHASNFSLNIASTVSGRVWGMQPHMHLKGTRFHVEANTGTCLIDLPRWDFHWEEMFFFKDGAVLPPGTTVSLRCTWDNPTDQTIVDGSGIDNEMCALGMLVAD